MQSKERKKKRQPAAAFSKETELLFDDLQDFHGAGLDTNAASDALGNRRLFLMYHDLHGAGLHTSAAANAQLLIDHVNTGLGVLGDRAVFTGLHALTALDTNHGLSTAVLAGNDLNAGIIGVELLIKCLGASLNALQAGHALGILLNGQLLHRMISFLKLSRKIIHDILQNGNRKIEIYQKYLLFPGVK
jgi:hypothetical protein